MFPTNFSGAARPRWSFLARAVALALVAAGTFSAASGSTAVDARPLEGIPITWSVPEGLAHFGNSVYWTQNESEGPGSTWSAIYTESTTGSPGQEHGIFRLEHHGKWVSFGDITGAYVDGELQLFIVINEPDRQVSFIEGVGLDGFATMSVAAPGYIGTREIAADGNQIFWSDTVGLHTVPIDGGSVFTFIRNPNITHVGFDRDRVYFAAGPYIRSAYKTGGGIKIVVHAARAVSAMHVYEGFLTTIYFGEVDGSVQGYNAGNVWTIWGPHPGRPITSVGYGAHIVWTSCRVNGILCSATYWWSGANTVASGQNGAFDAQSDASAMYWATKSGIYRYVY